MGVHGLWQLVSPVARPVQLESLRDRKLAIDASIWIHQFMRTMRSEDGSVLRSGHTLGFFRRICKLLFYNIKPVFVFDGGAPTLKRSTLRERRKRRQGMKENIKRTAEKILKAQLRTQLVKEEEKRRMTAQVEQDSHANATDDQDEDYTYLEQLDNSSALDKLRQLNAIKRDQYELPPLANDKDSTGKKSRNRRDPRLATNEELQDFIDEFKPSDIDMDSSVFQALPTEIQYEIIQDAKLKSRQTSWARLDNMVRQSKTPLDFSKQQIMQLKHRNEMTQRVMHMNDMASKSTDNSSPNRIAGERGKQYLLVKNENLEDGLGWKLPGVATKPSATVTEAASSPEEATTSINQHLDKTDGMDLADDPVARAVASDPRLAALMGDLDNDEGDDADMQPQQQNEIYNSDSGAYPSYYDDSNGDYLSDDHFEDETPLFTYQPTVQQQQQQHQPMDEWENHGFETHQDGGPAARNQILSKLYNDDYQTESFSPSSQQYSYDSSSNPQDSINDDHSWELELDADDFYKLWLSRVPDAFIYMHSFNNEYITLLKEAISDASPIPVLETQLKLVQKVFGKSNDSNAMTHEAYWFHQCFLEHTLAWKQRLANETARLAMYRENRLVNDDKPTDSPVILDDDDDDDDIQLTVANDSQQSIQSHVTSPQDTNVTPVVPLEHSKPMDSTFLAATMLSQEPRRQEHSDDADHSKAVDEPPVETTSLSSPADKAVGESPVATAAISSPVGKAVGEPPVATAATSSSVDENSSGIDNTTTTDVPPIAMYSSGNESSGIDDTTTTDAPDTAMYSSGNEGSDNDDVSTTDAPATAIYSSGNESDGMDDSSGNEEDPSALAIELDDDDDLAGTTTAAAAEEENAEFARFFSDIVSRDLSSVQQELADDVQHLNKQQYKQMGNADTVTDQMVQDIQELLQLFGVPYVVSPMEAEAQCAYLLEHNLVDGVVTDDSDVFLFGGSRVYKNMFNQEKYVECYLIQDIGREMHLDRTKLIQLAYFLGSDYTPGLPGIGYVSAMEILAAFQDDNDDDNGNDERSLVAPLHRFKQWYDSGTDNTDFERKFRKKHTHLDIPPDFPNPLVKDAYYSPLVDTSLERFTWSPPQLDSLRLHLMKSLHWSEEKTDEILIPVIREMNQRQATGIQTTISSFFDPSAGLHSSPSKKARKHKSVRIQNVVKKLGKYKKTADNDDDDDSSSQSETEPKVVKKPRRKRTTP
ncbi:hypothetical protein [Absidia glauca]|uniref:PIN domain-like protein n=1 Tax=Absidia glauca TaxID=4829 RepID=A0A163KM32_ABSGL|nr:hypothetical protein [Absidia glauca]